jgi:diadenosine tetraphosphate (Ap4A) HIT family hydrolase
MSNRTRRVEKSYRKYRSAPERVPCDFCIVKKGDYNFVSESPSFKVLHNIFPYALWDEQTVTDHLMIVPKQHIDSLKSLKPSQAAEYLAAISEYEHQGYSVYARAPGSLAKSIIHQHTHLIKTEGAPKRVVILIRKPHIMLAR